MLSVRFGGLLGHEMRCFMCKKIYPSVFKKYSIRGERYSVESVVKCVFGWGGSMRCVV